MAPRGDKKNARNRQTPGGYQKLLGKENDMLTSETYTTAELSVRYDRANYTTRDRIGCGLSCPTCSHCLYGNDSHKQESPDSACFCTISRKG